jgi:NAD(P)-dependent dehydrogenase (short-subunit alcohol dehydrogenase family)
MAATQHIELGGWRGRANENFDKNTRGARSGGYRRRQGIGQAIALAFAERGARVIATDLNPPQETVRKIGPKRATWEQQAIKRMGGSEDVTGAVLFLTSDDAAFITWQAIVVDGGQYRIG